jgi:hypothetical protein
MTHRSEGEPHFVLPKFVDGKIGVSLTFGETDMERYALAADQPIDVGTIEVAAEPALEKVSPEDGTSARPRDLKFAWESHGQAGYLKLWPDDRSVPDQPSVRIVFDGSATEMTLPDLSEFGLSWPKNTAYSWVLETSVDESVDDAAAHSEYAAQNAGYVWPRKLLMQ